MNNKRGISDIVIAVLLVIVSLSLVTIIYSVIIPMIKDNGDKIDTSLIYTKLEIKQNSVNIDPINGRLQLNIIRGDDNSELSTLKVIVIGDKKINNYFILDYPKTLESRDYLLNISDIGKPSEILIYPTSSKDKIGYVSRYEFSGLEGNDIDVKNIIEPQILLKDNCIPDWNCLSWSKCIVSYSLNDVTQNNILLNSIQTRECIDNNQCVFNIDEKKDCDNSKQINISSSEKDGIIHLDIFDSDNKLVSKLDLIKGEQDKLNIEIPVG